MKKISSFFILLLVLTNLNAQHDNEKENITKSIQTFFEGLQKGDTLALNKVLNNDLKLQTIYVNKEGINTLTSQTKKTFINTIANKKPSDIWFEKLLFLDIKIDENLASVWAPYEFYFNNKFSHCGVNSFQLFKNDHTWEIIYIVDTRRMECK